MRMAANGKCEYSFCMGEKRCFGKLSAYVRKWRFNFNQTIFPLGAILSIENLTFKENKSF